MLRHNTDRKGDYRETYKRKRQEDQECIITPNEHCISV